MKELLEKITAVWARPTLISGAKEARFLLEKKPQNAKAEKPISVSRQQPCEQYNGVKKPVCDSGYHGAFSLLA